MRFAAQIRLMLLLVLVLGCLSPIQGQIPPGKAPQESSARAEVEKLIQKSGADVAVAFRSLDNSQELLIQPDKQFHAASAIIKIPVMIELYAEAQAGELRLSDPLPVHNSFRSTADGSIYRLNPNDDPDPAVYAAIGKTMMLRDLCDDMITHGSNLATNLLIEKLGADRIRQRLHALQADGVEFLGGFEGGKADKGGLSNTTSARGLLELLWALANGKAVSPKASQEMIGIIAHSTPAEAIAARLPQDSGTAHKTLEVKGVQHYAAIIYGPHSFVLVILVGGITDRDTSSALMAQIAHTLAAAIW